MAILSLGKTRLVPEELILSFGLSSSETLDFSALLSTPASVILDGVSLNVRPSSGAVPEDLFQGSKEADEVFYASGYGADIDGGVQLLGLSVNIFDFQ